MSALIVVDNPQRWPLAIPGIALVSGRSYLTDPRFSDKPGLKIFNLCRSYRYQTVGYYVSLLAEARGHKPLPGVSTLQDLRSATVVRALTEDLEKAMQSALRPLVSDRFELSVYFGQNMAKRHEKLAQGLFAQFPAPLLRAQFRRAGERWSLQSVKPIAASEIPPAHHEFVAAAATAYFARRARQRRRRRVTRYDLAVLHDPAEAQPPSNARALARFERAAAKLGLGVELITRDDLGRVAEFDGLFIRTTTAVNHYSFRFAQRALAEGLTVVDDPDSIIRCSNKVYLAELLGRHKVATPKTLIVHRDNMDRVAPTLGLPCVLKAPDSAFSLGVSRADTPAALAETLGRLLARSELVVAQEYLPTDFDWRVGIFDRRPLYACRYFMARRHWQIIRHGGDVAGYDEGVVETLRVADAPPAVVRAAVRAARLIGDGLYGVDLKQTPAGCKVIEVNDNPNIDAGFEDRVLEDVLYRDIMTVFLRRIEGRKQARVRR